MKLSKLAPILFLTAVTSVHAQDPIRQATEARFWLKVPAGQPPLNNVSVSIGQLADSVWDKNPDAAKRQKDIRFPVRWWAWQEVTVTFTATYDGPLDLVLNGLWAQEKPGSIFREEALWDEIVATGATVQNGGFELGEGPVPEGWTSSGGYPAATDWPLTGTAALEGRKVAASWHNRQLQQTLQVKSGQTVTLTLHAKAATPPGFVPPKLLGKDTPAHQALAKLKRGVNIGNTWEAPPPYSWGIRYTPEDIDRIAAEGFDHIRVPVGWHFYLKRSPEGVWQIDPAMLADLEPVLKRALEKKLHVLLDWHHFYDLDKDPVGVRNRFIEGWTAIANHFKGWPPELFFELLNEPHDKMTTELLNPIQADAIAAIRKTNPERILVLSPGDWGKVEELDKLVLPDDERLVVTVHCYEPFIFTHQNSSWTHLKALKGVVYPGPPSVPLVLPDSLKSNIHLAATIQEYNTLTGSRNPSSPTKLLELLDNAKRWSDHFGRPVHLGEFGAISLADPESRLRYVRDVKTAAEARNIPWTLWEWKANFGYWDSKTNQPTLRSAIFE